MVQLSITSPLSSVPTLPGAAGIVIVPEESVLAPRELGAPSDLAPRATRDRARNGEALERLNRKMPALMVAPVPSLPDAPPDLQGQGLRPNTMY
jgi:hypothetical protein